MLDQRDVDTLPVELQLVGGHGLAEPVHVEHEVSAKLVSRIEKADCVVTDQFADVLHVPA